MREFFLTYDFFNSVLSVDNCSQMPICCDASLTGFERVPGAMPGPRTGPGQDQGPHVADPVRGGLPPQPSDRPPGRQTTEHSCVQLGHAQDCGLWPGPDIRLQRPSHLNGKLQNILIFFKCF